MSLVYDVKRYLNTSSSVAPDRFISTVMSVWAGVVGACSLVAMGFPAVWWARTYTEIYSEN